MARRQRYTAAQALERVLQEDSSDDSSDNETVSSEPNEIIDDPELEDDDDNIVQRLVADIHRDHNNMLSKNGEESWTRIPNQEGGRAAAYNVIRNVSGPTNYVRDICGISPDNAFKVFITPAVMQKIVDCTNVEGHLVSPTWEDTDVNELYKFCGILILSGAHRDNRTSITDLWSTRDGRPIFNKAMPRNRFTSLLRCLRFDIRVGRDRQDKFSPLRTIFEEIVSNFRRSFIPGAACTVDEQLVSFRGRCPFKMYIPSKPGKYGIKLWALCDTTSYYCLNLQPYIGRLGNVPERRQGERVVLDLTDMLTGSGRHLYMDNFFTSLPLARIMLGRRMTMTGTMRKNKPELPNQMLPDPSRPELSSIFGFQNNATLVSYVPKKNRAVILLSTNHPDATVDDGPKKKPQMIIDYNKGKCGVDTLDQLVRTYNCIRKTNRWPVILFMNLLNISAYNALVLYLHIHPEYERTSGKIRKRFLLEMARSLIGLDQDDNPLNAPRRQGRGRQRRQQPQRRCVICPRGLDRKTPRTCQGCNRPICAQHVVYKCRDC